MIQIVPIVEGHGESRAVPLLIRRIAVEYDPSLMVRVQPPTRRPYGQLVKPDVLERDVEAAARRAGAHGGVFIVLDCEDSLPCRCAPALLARARRARPDMPVGLVMAYREYETWFLSAAGSLRGKQGLPEDLQPPLEPERIRGAKEWLGRQMPGGKYSETIDQEKLTAALCLADARRASSSFDKCYREVTRLLDELRRQQPLRPRPWGA